MNKENFKILEELFYKSSMKNKESSEPLPPQNEEWKEKVEESLLKVIKEALESFPVSESHSGKEDRQYIVERSSAIIEVVTYFWCSFIESQIINHTLRCFTANGVDFQDYYMKVIYPCVVNDIRKKIIEKGLWKRSN